MGLPPRLQQKYLARFETLIAEGEGIHADMQVTTSRHEYWDRTSDVRRKYQVDWGRFVEWRTKVASLLSNIVPESNVNHRAVINIPNLSNQKGRLEYGIALLKGIREDFTYGLLDDLVIQIEAEISADYMSQAEALLGEGQKSDIDHIPAAVLAGAVLEKALRTICSNNKPPITTENTKGVPLMLNALIDKLKKAGVYNEATAKQLRAWADIRNHAAHGEFDQFKRSQVELMVQGIDNFLANYLR